MGVAPRVGILGGTFDPVHNAHLVVAEAAREALGLTQVVLVPAGQPWLKGHEPAAAAGHSETISARSESPPGLTPQCSPAARKPSTRRGTSGCGAWVGSVATQCFNRWRTFHACAGVGGSLKRCLEFVADRW